MSSAGNGEAWPSTASILWSESRIGAAFGPFDTSTRSRGDPGSRGVDGVETRPNRVLRIDGIIHQLDSIPRAGSCAAARGPVNRAHSIRRQLASSPMIILRRAEERRHDLQEKRDGWLSFHAHDGAQLVSSGFGSLQTFDEYRLAALSSMPRSTDRDSETLTYVREGSLAYEDSSGSSGVIQAGEFQRSTIARGAWYREENASRTDSAQVFRASIRPSQVGSPPGHERRRFSVAERRGGLCVIASPDARKGSLLLHQDALIHSALLDPGQHVVYELGVGRSAWVHVVDGEITLAGIVLTTGDGSGVQGERAVSFTATEEAEVLLLDVGDAA